MNLVFIHTIVKAHYLGRVPLPNDRSESEKDAIAYAIRNGFMTVKQFDTSKAETTEKGRAFCEALKAVKEPVPTWGVPE